MSEAKRLVDDHVRALISIVRAGLEPDQYAVRDDGLREAREALDELEASLFPGDQGEWDELSVDTAENSSLPPCDSDEQLKARIAERYPAAPEIDRSLASPDFKEPKP